MRQGCCSEGLLVKCAIESISTNCVREDYLQNRGPTFMFRALSRNVYGLTLLHRR